MELQGGVPQNVEVMNLAQHVLHVFEIGAPERVLAR